jgi:hypothetical protein
VDIMQRVNPGCFFSVHGLAAAILATYVQSVLAYIETVRDPVPLTDPRPGDIVRSAYPIPANISAAAPDMIMWQFSYTISTIPIGTCMLH